MNIFINTKQENRNKLRLKDDKLFYLAYGSNLNEKQMLNLRCPGAIKIGSIYLEGFRLVFREVADFAEDSSSHLGIGLWEISKQHEQSLDIYEGVNSGLYKKIFWEISINDTSYKALIYKMNILMYKKFFLLEDFESQRCKQLHKENNNLQGLVF